LSISHRFSLASFFEAKMMRDTDAMKKLLALCLALAPVIWLTPLAYADSIAYFYALDADLAALAKAGKLQGAPKDVNGQSVSVIRVGDHEIFALKMGSGSARTAVAAATLLTKMPCELALSTGPAGDVSNRFSVGQWVRVTEVAAYQEGSEMPAGFVAAKGAIRKLATDMAMPAGGWEDLPAARIASGETFVSSPSFRRVLGKESDAVDMNLAGLTIACAAAGVPLACWKVISDHADEHAGEDFAKFVKAYDGEGGRQIAALVGNLPKNPKKPDSYQNLNRLLDGETKP
jgi:nucleoside phosphorylase